MSPGMAVPLRYNLCSLAARWRSALWAVLGIALTVAVFILVLALAGGLRATYLNTGDARNLLVLRKGALAESSSQITPDEARRTEVLEGIARDAQESARQSYYWAEFTRLEGPVVQEQLNRAGQRTAEMILLAWTLAQP